MRQTVRCHGGSHQPRHYQMKERGEANLVRYLEAIPQVSPIQRKIEEMRDAALRTTELLDRIKRVL